MVLVRRRTTLAGLIVARLHAASVPVAGIDRLRLGAPLVVKDLLAALRFAVQPHDDLTLANLLVSPLLGWSQDDLLAHAPRPGGVSLWQHLRSLDAAPVQATVAHLGALLARADYDLPDQVLHWLLVGPWQGRARLRARLGRECLDAIDELVNAALGYAATSTPSLAGFLAWFEAGDADVKRDPEGGGGVVRVMTVHGAKGLQAPIVILADAAGDPDNARGGGISLTEPASGLTVPLPRLGKDERRGRIAEAVLAAREAELAEHWRLLYVAMTRAEEALYIAGTQSKKKLPEKSWYAKVEPLFAEALEYDDPIWGARQVLGTPPPLPAAMPDRQTRDPNVVLPALLTQPVAPEPRPPRPLAPSAAAGEDAAEPPARFSAAGAVAARRGTLIHRLIERLPAVAPDRRAAAAAAWLAREASDFDAPARADMAAAALGVLDHADFAAVFGPGSLAEVPFSAVVGGQVITGTIDRLLVTPDRVLLVDFKTSRSPPTHTDAIPRAYLAQLGAYAAALGVIYPGRSIAAALLYTHGPLWFDIAPEVLAAHKPALAPTEQSVVG